jgi:dynein assembly factor 2
MGLLSEYMVEISDPKNKKEYDDYLLQMEADGELPKHMKLIKPTPQFCVKTALIAHSNKSQ